MKEPEIKLFGRKILVPENGGGEIGEYPDLSSDETDYEISGGRSGGGSDPCCLEVSKQPVDEEQLAREVQEMMPQDNGQDPGIADESQDGNASAEIDDNPKISSTDEDVVLDNHSKTETDQSDVTNTQQKILKKPDKILPCPRCNSMDTKFCYYNNYNVNQHRHFCKSCQRYWTAGGTMRNVPVGAGRRKNKNSTSHATISEALLAARMDIPNGFHHQTFKPNGTVLSFGPDSPFCESMASAMSLADQRLPNGVRNGHCKIDQRTLVPCENGKNGYDHSLGSSVTTSNSMEGGVKKGNQKPVLQNLNGIPSPSPSPSQFPYVPGVPWPFPWNSAVPVPAICPQGFPMPIYPGPYWNCSVPVAWNVPLLSVPSPTSNQKPPGSASSPDSPLGKHSRNGELLKPNIPEGKEPVESKNSESSILIPKTLRIDDPEDAAKSSIWATLGIKYDSISRKGLFTSLQPKSDEKKPMAVTSSPVLQANPAALSRSISFQETA